MKEETPSLIKAVCLTRGFVDTSEQHQLNSPSLELDLGEIGAIDVWGRHYTPVYLDFSQGYEERARILETEDVELFTRALDDLIASCKRFSEYREQADGVRAPDGTGKWKLFTGVSNETLIEIQEAFYNLLRQNPEYEKYSGLIYKRLLCDSYAAQHKSANASRPLTEKTEEGSAK